MVWVGVFYIYKFVTLKKKMFSHNPLYSVVNTNHIEWALYHEKFQINFGSQL